MIQIIKADNANTLLLYRPRPFGGFLYTHLDRFRDDKQAISKAIDYAFRMKRARAIPLAGAG
jgi:hypothetical protein